MNRVSDEYYLVTSIEWVAIVNPEWLLESVEADEKQLLIRGNRGEDEFLVRRIAQQLGREAKWNKGVNGWVVSKKVLKEL